MRIYEVKFRDKTVTVKRMKLSSLNSQFISSPNTNFSRDDEVFVRCGKTGKAKYYNKQYIVYPISLPVIKVIYYERPIIKFLKQISPFK